MSFGPDVVSVPATRGSDTFPRGSDTDPRRIRHIRIEIGTFAIDYQARADQIADIVAELGTEAGLVVTVDDEVVPELPPLPCGALWS